MEIIASKLYDPAGAVSKATSSLLAMTAFDTANLRLAVVVPAHGMVRFRLRCAVTGATTVPTILLGVLNGATVVGRVVPVYGPFTANLATQDFVLDAEFIATGLAPGATNFDAAYGVEVVVASTNIKYGGPNDTTTNNAWGGFLFEAWDPDPRPANFALMSIDASGRVDVAKVAGTVQTAGDIIGDTNDIQARLPAALTANGNIKASLLEIIGNTISETAVGRLAAAFKKFFDVAAPTGTLNSIPGAVAGAAGGLAIVGSDMGVVASVTGNVGGNVVGSVGSVTGAVGSVTGNVGGNVAGSVGSVTAGVTVSVNGDKTGYTLTAAYDLAKTAAQVADVPTANQNADALLDRANAIEAGFSLRYAIRVTLAALAGKVSGADANAPIFRNATDTKDRIAATTDADGNRSVVTLDGS